MVPRAPAGVRVVSDPARLAVVAAAVGAWVACAPGCVRNIQPVIQPAAFASDDESPARDAPDQADDAAADGSIWPERVSDPSFGDSDRTVRGVVFPLGQTRLRMARLSEDAEYVDQTIEFDPNDESRVIIRGGAIFHEPNREQKMVSALRGTERDDLPGEAVEIEFLGVRELAKPVIPVRLEGRGSMWGVSGGPVPEGTESFAFVSGTLDQDVDGEWLIRVERTWYQLVEAATPEPRGVVLLIPGMFGTPEPVVERFVRALSGRGYAVVRFLAHSARFTEEVTIDLDPADLASAADRIAQTFGERAAENAYAASAAVRDALERRPSWRDKPVAAVGFSGGAMVLPTVLAYDPDLYDAAVYVAGGAHFWRIAQESNYRQWIDSVRWRWLDGAGGAAASVNNTPPAAGLKRELDRLYLERAPLDSARTGELVRGVPTLMVHAANDQAVPAELGDLLWERLGRPERRVLPVGHELLFVTLPTQFLGIIDWLDGAVSAQPRPSDH